MKKTMLECIKKLNDEITKCESCKELIWKFFWDCGREGNVTGIFKATQEDIKNAIGKDVSFGEILGKHSEIYGTLEERDISLISDNPIVVINSEECGYNPLEYIIEYDD